MADIAIMRLQSAVKLQHNQQAEEDLQSFVPLSPWANIYPNHVVRVSGREDGNEAVSTVWTD